MGLCSAILGTPPKCRARGEAGAAGIACKEHTAHKLSDGKKAGDFVSILVQHCAVCVDLEAAIGQSDAVRDRISAERARVEGLRPIGFRQARVRTLKKPLLPKRFE